MSKTVEAWPGCATDLESDRGKGHEAAAHQKAHAGSSCSKLHQMTEELRKPVERIPHQLRVLVFAAILAALAGLLIGLPLYAALAAAQFGETSATTAVNMPQEQTAHLVELAAGKARGELTLLQHPTLASFLWLKVTVQDFDILDLQARIDMEIIAAGDYSDPQQPAALQLPPNTQLVLQTANRVHTYASGDVPGAFAVTVPLAVERPLLFYPFDAYSIELVISLSLEQLVQCADNSTLQTGPGAAVAQAGCNPALRNSSRALPLPLIVRAKNRVDTMRVPLRLNSFRELISGPGAAAEPQPGPVSIYLQAHGRHTPFVCAYAVALTLMCVAIGLYLTVMALDQAFVRPRALAPATINTFAACLFSIPRIRSSLPGNIPAGMLIDMFGFGWATILTGCGLLLMISLYVVQYSHQAKLFQSEKKTN